MVKLYSITFDVQFYQVNAKTEEQAIRVAYARLLDDVKAQNIDTEVEELPN